MNGTMSTSLRESFPTGRTFAATLTSTAQFVAAEKLLAEGNTLPDFASVVTLPQFAIVDFDGRETINRIQWDCGTNVLIVPDDTEKTLSWKVEDSTLPTQAGTLTVRPEVSGGHRFAGTLPRLAPGTEPRIRSGLTTSAHTRHLRAVQQEGKQEMFRLVMLLIPYVRQSVESASRRIYREIHDLAANVDVSIIPVIDQVEADVVVDLMLYGANGRDWSMVTRLIRRAAATDAVVKKSVMQFMSTAIWSSAETHVRSAIGDPHAGRTIRRLARVIQSSEPATVLAAYRQSYPNSQMGLGRVTAALTAGATVGAQQVAWDSLEENETEAVSW